MLDQLESDKVSTNIKQNGALRVASKTATFGTVARGSHDSTDFYNLNLYKELFLLKQQGAKQTKAPQLLVKTKSPIKKPSANQIAVQERTYNKVFCQSSEKIKFLKSNSIHLVVTSPPYNVGKTYDKNLTIEEYLSFLKRVFSEMYRVLVDGGRVCINLANIGRKPYLPITDMVTRMMLKIGYQMRGEIIGDKGNSASPSIAGGSWRSASNPVLRDVHEYILVFSKGGFKREAQQKNLIARDEFLEFTKSIGRINTESARRVKHPAPFPIELPRRLIKLFSFEDDLILDPFIGSGTTAIAALETKRKFIGIDNDESYVAIANARIAKGETDHA